MSFIFQTGGCGDIKISMKMTLAFEKKAQPYFSFSLDEFFLSLASDRTCFVNKFFFLMKVDKKSLFYKHFVLH